MEYESLELPWYDECDENDEPIGIAGDWLKCVDAGYRVLLCDFMLGTIPAEVEQRMMADLALHVDAQCREWLEQLDQSTPGTGFWSVKSEPRTNNNPCLRTYVPASERSRSPIPDIELGYWLPQQFQATDEETQS